VHGATGPFTLVLAESYAPGWVVDGLPNGWSARHVEVDGYGNGWLITGSGNAVLTLQYGPDRWCRAALIVSALGATLALGLAGWRRWARRAPRGSGVPVTTDH